MSDDFNARWANRQRALEDSTKLNRDAILVKLRELKIRPFTVTYDGSGDSGQIHDVPDYVPNVYVTWIETYPGHWPQKPQETKTVPLRRAVEDICYNILSIHHSGWENDEGAEGSFVFDADANTIKLEHGTYIRETQWSERDI